MQLYLLGMADLVAVKKQITILYEYAVNEGDTEEVNKRFSQLQYVENRIHYILNHLFDEIQ